MDDTTIDQPTDEPGGAAHDLPPTPAPRGRRTATVVSSVVVILAVAAGAAFAVRSVRSSSSGGSSTPEAAVRHFLDAAANEDALGVLASLVPGERDALRTPIQDLVVQLSRLGVLSPNVDLSKVPGFQIAFTGLQLSTSSLDANHAVVSTVGGTVTSRIDPSAVPVGPFIRNLAGHAFEGNPSTQTESLTGDHAIRLVAVRQNGHWYTSIAYSIAEAARRQSGGPVPKFGAGIQPAGAQTAEAATRQLLQALTSFDFVHAIALLAPEESAAFRDYAGTYMDEIAQAGADARRNVTIDLKTIDLGSEVRAGETLVTVKRLLFSASAEGGRVHVAWDGNCVTTSGLPFAFARAPICGDALKRLGGLPANAPKPDIGFVCVQQGGLWYVSPTRTILEGLTAVLRTLKPSDLTSLTQLFQTLSGGLTGNPFSIPPSVAPLLPSG